MLEDKDFLNIPDNKFLRNIDLWGSERLGILIVFAIVFVIVSVLVVIPAVWLSGKIRDWVQEDRIQLEALKRWQERKQKRRSDS